MHLFASHCSKLSLGEQPIRERDTDFGIGEYLTLTIIRSLSFIKLGSQIRDKRDIEVIWQDYSKSDKIVQ